MCYGETEHGCHAGYMLPRANMARGMCPWCGGMRFLSKKERIELLEDYLESLKSEIEGVEEELKELKRE